MPSAFGWFSAAVLAVAAGLGGKPATMATCCKSALSRPEKRRVQSLCLGSHWRKPSPRPGVLWPFPTSISASPWPASWSSHRARCNVTVGQKQLNRGAVGLCNLPPLPGPDSPDRLAEVVGRGGESPNSVLHDLQSFQAGSGRQGRGRLDFRNPCRAAWAGASRPSRYFVIVPQLPRPANPRP